MVLLQISYLEGVIRTHESGIAELEADNVKLTQVSYDTKLMIKFKPCHAKTNCAV
jgi:hypothetical protein